MNFQESPIPGAFLIDLEKRGDERGFFARVFCEKGVRGPRLVTHFVAGQQTRSAPRAARCAACTTSFPPKAETKLVRCVRGALWDAIVDLRPGSPTFGKSFERNSLGREPADALRAQGLRHGFVHAQRRDEALYFVDEFYGPSRAASRAGTTQVRHPSGRCQPVVLSDKDRDARDFDPKWHLGA